MTRNFSSTKQREVSKRMRKEKTNIAMLWIAILVLEISLMIDSYHDYQIHYQLRLQQEKKRQMFLEHLKEETEHQYQVNQYLEQILNTAKAH